MILWKTCVILGGGISVFINRRYFFGNSSGFSKNGASFMEHGLEH